MAVAARVASPASGESAGGASTASMGAASGGVAVRAKGVCPAFLDVYVGGKPISPAAKAGIAAGFAAKFYQD